MLAQTKMEIEPEMGTHSREDEGTMGLSRKFLNAAIPFAKVKSLRPAAIQSKLSFSMENVTATKKKNSRSKMERENSERTKNCAELDKMKIAAIQYTHTYTHTHIPMFAMAKLDNSK